MQEQGDDETGEEDDVTSKYGPNAVRASPDVLQAWAMMAQPVEE